jgi:hypothetical protein
MDYTTILMVGVHVNSDAIDESREELLENAGLGVARFSKHEVVVGEVLDYLCKPDIDQSRYKLPALSEVIDRVKRRLEDMPWWLEEARDPEVILMVGYF